MESLEDSYRDEADRLSALRVEDQRAFIAMLRADAVNRKVPKRDRDFARERADALERILKLKRRKKK